MNAVAPRTSKSVSHSDQGGRGDGVQIMVHRGYAYIGHGYSNGISVLDVRDPKNPRPIAFLPCPPDTRAIHLQTHDDLLLAVNGPSMWTMQVDAQAYYSGSPADLLKGRQYTAGIRIFDIAHPEAPREIAFMATEGVGPHRIWYVGGRYAYSRSTIPSLPTRCWRSSTWRSRRGPRSSASGGSPACGRAAAKRRVGQRAGATGCTTLSSPATSPMPPGAMAGSPCSTSAIRPGPSCSPIATSTHPSAAARIRRCRCPIATSWCSLTRPISPIAAKVSATPGSSTCAS